MESRGDTIRPEELLAQLGWVRALARSLVRDAGMADDVLQQVCLLALERAPHGARTGPGLRAWLSAVTRSLARRSARAHLRRVRREQVAAQPEALPSTLELAAQREALAALVQAVTGLEEPYFSTIMQRYFQGDSVAEISARQRISAVAVRQRLSRARSQLRARLGRAIADDRSGALRALLPLAPAGAALEGARATSSIQHIGGSIMARKVGAGSILKFAASLLVVAGLCFVSWRALRGSAAAPQAPAQAVRVVAPPASAAPARPQLPAPAAPQAVSPLAPSADATLAHLVGRVTRRDTGEPLVGARVQVVCARVQDEVGAGSVVPEEMHVVTDDDGQFRVAVFGAGRATSIAVQPGPGSRGATHAVDLLLEPGMEIRQDVQVSSGATLAGTIVDRQGRGVTGARVRGWNESATALDGHPDRAPDQEVASDAQGQFRLGGLGPHCVVAADVEGLAGTARLTGEFADGALAEGLTLTLGPMRDIGGQVLGDDGQPLDDCIIVATPEEGDPGSRLTGIAGVFFAEPPRAATRSEGGAFLLEGLADVAYELQVSSDTHEGWSGRHAPGDPDPVIRLGTGTHLGGLILGPSGQPVAGAEVIVCSRPSGGWPVPLRTVRSDAAGRFEASGLSADEHGLILVRAAGHALDVQHPVAISAGQPGHVRIVLAAARALAGTVVDGDGRPVAGARLSITGDRVLPLPSGVTMSPLPTWEALLHGAHVATTDAAGSFRFDELYDGLFELRVAAADGSGTAALVEVRSGNEALRVVVDASRPVGVTLVGSVHDALTGQAVPAFRLTPMVPNGGGFSGDEHAFDSADGSFRLTGLTPGIIAIGVRAPGYAALSLPADEYAAGEYRLDLALKAERVLRLRVVDTDREPVSAKVTCLGESGATLLTKDAENRGVSPRATDDQGELVLMGLPAERITVRIKQGWFGSGEEFVFDLRRELPGTQVLVLGGDGQATVLVLCFGTTEPLSIDTETQGFAAAMQSLQQQIDAGLVSAAETPVTVRARTADGRIVADRTLDPRAPASDATPVPGVEGACNLRVTVPAEPLDFEVSAPGYETVRRAWQADRADDASDVLLVVLRKS